MAFDWMDAKTDRSYRKKTNISKEYQKVLKKKRCSLEPTQVSWVWLKLTSNRLWLGAKGRPLS